MNRVELIGRLTKHPEPRRSPAGSAVLKFTLAVNRQRKQPGQPEADFISCTAFGKIAENMERYLDKGSQVSVEGRIQTGSYVNKSGQTVYTTDVICDHVGFLDQKKQAAQPGYQQPVYQQAAYQEPAYGSGGYEDPDAANFASGTESDLPF